MIAHNRTTDEEIKNILLIDNCILIERYIDKISRTRIIFIDSEGYKFDLDYQSYKRQTRKFIDISNPFSLENICLWIERNNKSFLLLENNEYLGKDVYNLKMVCLVCKQEFFKSWATIRRGSGCPYCSKNKTGKFNNLKYAFPDIANELSNKNSFSAENISPYSHVSAIWICSNCDNEWITSSIAERTAGGNGCPRCCESKGEKNIIKFLEKYNTRYSRQFRFKNCINKNPLPFDFYLSDYDLCIEYQGEQHYGYRKRNDMFGGEEGFKKRQINDKIKETYCKDNNINLLIIPYWEFDNIENILSQTLLEIEGGN